mgnify:CR=1 FL=1
MQTCTYTGKVLIGSGPATGPRAGNDLKGTEYQDDRSELDVEQGHSSEGQGRDEPEKKRQHSDLLAII